MKLYLLIAASIFSLTTLTGCKNASDDFATCTTGAPPSSIGKNDEKIDPFTACMENSGNALKKEGNRSNSADWIRKWWRQFF